VNKGSKADPPFRNNLGSINIESASQFVVGTGGSPLGGYDQLADSTLGEMISKNAFGTITVIGSASLNGTLDLLLQGDSIRQSACPTTLFCSARTD
jgi:hypothetical protein